MNIISLTVKNATKVVQNGIYPSAPGESCDLQTPCCFGYTILETPQNFSAYAPDHYAEFCVLLERHQ